MLKSIINILFFILVNARNWLYDSGIINIYKSQLPVISIGNITAGGTGKTPFVLYLTKLVLKKGLKPLIISRGYKRNSSNLFFFNWEILEKSDIGPDFVGDEPYLISKKFPNVDIIVNKDRVSAVKFAENLDVSYDVIILDDAFQHRSIYRDLDILLINTNQEHKSLLPKGLLREPYKNISRADCIVLTKNNPKFNFTNKNSFKIPVFECEEVYSLSKSKNKGVGFCGIGSPSSFWRTLDSLSVSIEKKIEFADHQKYGPSSIKKIEALFVQNKTFFTTEKDWIKLPKDFIDKHDGVFVKMDVNIKNDGFNKLIDNIC